MLCQEIRARCTFLQAQLKLLKRERIKRRIYLILKRAESDVFDYIEMFYSLKRRHGFNEGFSTIGSERQV